MNLPIITGLETYYAQASLLLGVFWFLFLAFRSHPRARVYLCRAVAIAVALLPIAQFLPAPGIVRLPDAAFLSQPLPVVFPKLDSPFTGGSQSRLSPAIPSRMASNGASFADSRPSLDDLLLTAWLAGSGLLLTRLGLRFARSRRLMASAQPAPRWLEEAVVVLRKTLRLRPAVSVAIIEQACSPLLLGPVPVILLPRGLVDQTDREDALAALAHEMSHVCESDWVWSHGLQVVSALLWTSPLIWFLRRAHDASSEFVCDQIAAGLHRGATRYAGSLARQTLFALETVGQAAVPMVGRSGIRSRVDRLLSGAVLPPLTRRVMGGLVFSLLITSTLLAGIRLARGESPSAASSTANWARYNYSPGEVQAIIGKMCGYFQAIDSLSYTGMLTSTVAPDKRLVEKTAFAGSADRYLFQLDHRYVTLGGQPIPSEPGYVPENESLAYNGTIFQRLEYDGPSHLRIQKGPPFWPVAPSLDHVHWRDYLTLPFDFVNVTLTDDPHHSVQLTPSQFGNPDSWRLRTRRIQNGTLLGKRGLIVAVEGAVPFAPGPVTMSVLLDPERNYYPVAWQVPVKSASGTQVFRISYVIDKIATMQGGGKFLPYPEIATLSADVDNKPMWSRTITIDTVSLNDIGRDDPRFTIDPSQVAIVQRDNGP